MSDTITVDEWQRELEKAKAASASRYVLLSDMAKQLGITTGGLARYAKKRGIITTKRHRPISSGATHMVAVTKEDAQRIVKMRAKENLV